MRGRRGFFPVFCRGDFELRLETAGEITRGAETQPVGDVGDLQIEVTRQHGCGPLQFAVEDKVVWSHTCQCLEFCI